MRVLLDTNVLMSAIFFGGIPGHILSACRDQKITLVLSPEILEEYRAVAARLSAKFDVEYESLIEWIAVHSEMNGSVALPEPVSGDPDDDKFIACALASSAKLICSGDKHLLNVNGYCGLEILKPKAFAINISERSDSSAFSTPVPFA